MAQTVKNLPARQETWVQSLGWEDPLEEGMQYTLVFLPEEFPWTEEPAGYSPWGHKELDTTEATKHTHISIVAVLLFYFFLILVFYFLNFKIFNSYMHSQT